MQSFKMRLNRFVRSRLIMDLRPGADAAALRERCEKFARKNKTCGKRAVFVISED